MDSNNPNWWAVYKDLSSSPKDLIAFVKGTEKEMHGINIGLYYGTLKIRSEKPRGLNYKIKSQKKVIIHSMEEKDAIRISRIILPGRERKIEENPLKVWFEVKDLSEDYKELMPNAYFIKKSDAEVYSEKLPNGIITLTKNLSKKLEFRVLDEKNSIIAIFKKGTDARKYRADRAI